MSINDTHIMPPAHHVSLETPDTDGIAIAESELFRNIRESALTLIMPRLQTVFERLDAPCAQTDESSEQVLDRLSANITLLQDSFMDALYGKLHALGADASIKLTLRLNDEARLVVAGEHPDAEGINLLLATDLELIEAFVEIAAQSAALRDLRSLRTLTLYDRASDAYTALAAGPGECIYQLSLKGEMNHFYFTR